MRELNPQTLYLNTQTTYNPSELRRLLARVTDPELPVLSIDDLGVLRDITFTNNRFNIFITPTYSGCPALDTIKQDIEFVLHEHNIHNFDLITRLSPAWTTEWMSEAARQKLKAYGIAPPNPVHSVCEMHFFQQQEAVQCPRCDSYNTRLISQFGSTACKSLYQCNDCQEPFDHFKCH